MISVIVPVVRPHLIPALKDKVLAEGLDVEFLAVEDTERVGCPRMVKKLTESAKGDWVCFLGDDSDPRPGFLKEAFSHSDKYGLIGFNDGVSRNKATHWLASKSLLPKIGGEFFHTGYGHNFCDDELRVRADALGEYFWCEEALVMHDHPAFGKAPSDEWHAKANSTFNEDWRLFMERNGGISVAMIVRNEEAMLAECLESVKDADEIVIVDTGSEDRTKEVAARYTDRIYDFPWVEDFSAARNFAKSKCTMPWIISIDADEVLNDGGLSWIREKTHTPHDAIGIWMTNNVDNRYRVPRAFRNLPRVVWSGKIHEMVNAKYGESCDATILFRRSPAHDLDPHRNLRMLEAVYRDEPDNARNLYYLAREYAYYGRNEEALDTYSKCLAISGWKPERADAFFQMANICWRTGRPDEARRHCMDALTLNANFKAACRLMASMSWPENAVQWERMAETATDEGVLFTYRA